MAAYSRPLPTPPTGPRGSPFESYRGGQLDYRPDGYPPSFAPYAYPQTPQSPTTLPGGTLLHKGFYDLLSMIPTPSPSRLMWGPPPEEEPGLAGPRYEHIRPAAPPARGPPAGHAYPPSSPPVPRKTRRISKDMVSRPTGFVFVARTSYMLPMLTSLRPFSLGGVRTAWANWGVSFEARAGPALRHETNMLRKGQEGHVRAERDILKSAALVNSPGGTEWIVRMYYSFQDQYMGGGDLLNLLIERDVFDGSFVRFYVAEMILAIESCHKHGLIHRDIKPDNFLFDPTGHIKLSDFGLATDLHWAHDTSYYEQQRLHLLHKHGIDLEDTNGIANGRRTKRMNRQKVELLMGGDGPGGVFTWREKNRRKLAYSVCGTNSYMSPEVIRGHGYSYSCDWWSLGVIMYECLYGGPPFASDSRHVTRQKILNRKQALKFPVVGKYRTKG
ncbi:kinase-like domain-containing protein [Roridomyces roridus]|uniref:non-specific serine/threonine protein kinase n=1 Tax=Roridomyces roridus TaxID=1738132 RepID=A0AAD7CER5_9AGAR|nr:kinase-like domain-containing protein [Roridomyces roridus]